MAPTQSRMQGASDIVLKRQRDMKTYTKFPGRRYQLKDGRTASLEDLYLVPDHPQRADQGHAYIYYQDTTPAGLAASWEEEKKLEVPKGSREQIMAMSYLELQDGDAIWVADGKYFTLDMKEQLDTARDAILGPGICVGEPDQLGHPNRGTAYERSPTAKSVKEPARAYTLGPSLKSPTSIMAPVASAKMTKGQMHPDVDDRQLLLKAVAPFAMGTMRQGPKHVQVKIKKHSELINKPIIGSTDNWAYATMQLNLAAAKCRLWTQVNTSLSSDLGFFGATHVDKHDGASYYSNMTCDHDIPENYEPGMFFILKLGVFVILRKYSSMNFFGLCRHGEVINTGCSERRDQGWLPDPSTRHSSFIHEGTGMMTPAALMTFVVRSLLLFMFYMLQQLPQEYKVQFDPDLVIQAVTFEQDGRWVNVGEWALAPGQRQECVGPWNLETGGGKLVDQDELRSANWMQWDKYKTYVATHIPYLGHKGPLKTLPPKPNDSDDDSDDEEAVAAKKLQKMEAAKLKEEARKAAAEARKAVKAAAAAIAADPSKAKKKKKPITELEHTDTGVSDVEQSATVRGADARALWAARHRVMQEEEVEDSVPEEPSAKKLGKRKAAASNSPAVWSAPGAPLHRLTCQAAKASTGWSGISAGTTNVEMEDVSMAISRRRPVISFVETVMMEAHETNMSNIEYTCLTVAHCNVDQELAAGFESLDKTFAAMSGAPGSPETTVLISGIWSSLDRTTGHEAFVALTQCLCRHRIMMTNYFAWKWLDSYCSLEIETAVKELDYSKNWLTALTKDVQNAIENWVALKEFTSSSYQLDIAPCVYIYQCSAPRFFVDNALLAEVITLTTHIIAKWLKYPLTTLGRYRAWFIHAILEKWGEGALLLDEVWNSHMQLRKHVLGPSKDKEVVLERLQTLQNDLLHHPLANQTSSKALILEEVGVLVSRAQSGTLKYKPLEEIESPTMDDEHHPTNISWKCQMGRESRFLEEAAELQEPFVSRNLFQSHLHQKMDYLYPFREYAPSRQRAAGPSGPFTLDRVHTDAGILSALIFRRVTFGTDFFFQYPIFFNDITHFHKVKDQATANYLEANGENPPKSYFCDSAAYGPSNHRRVVELADEYANVLRNDSWEAKLQGREKLPFQECFEWLYGCTPTKAGKTTGKR
ncbi:hypothetical protein B0H10DRAFT_1939814 [Mycena sp. CBHHK59/15]|nr:hypothetical protein B0H10DRAFT_1939814 [Mycena sp. CBHHK59/15]